MEFFVEPGTDEEWHEYWLQQRWNWYVDLGHHAGEPALLRAPEGEAVPLLQAHRRHRVPLPLRRHRSSPSSRASPTAPTSTSPRTPSTPAPTCRTSTRRRASAGSPYVIEPAAGLTRAVLAFLLDAYDEDEAPNAKGGDRQAHGDAVRPAAGPGQGRGAAAVAQRRPVAEGAGPRGRSCAQRWNVEFDDAGAIGRRYRRQDEIGTPFCVTVDFDTLDDQAVTVRDRDTMSQERDRPRRRSSAGWPSACPAAERGAPARAPRHGPRPRRCSGAGGAPPIAAVRPGCHRPSGRSGSSRSSWSSSRSRMRRPSSGSRPASRQRSSSSRWASMTARAAPAWPPRTPVTGDARRSRRSRAGRAGGGSARASCVRLPRSGAARSPGRRRRRRASQLVEPGQPRPRPPPARASLRSRAASAWRRRAGPAPAPAARR